VVAAAPTLFHSFMMTAPPAPPANIPPAKGHNPHGDPGNPPAAQQQAVLFLLSGEVFDTRGGLPCAGVRTSG
jgi:hypothetical protein